MGRKDGIKLDFSWTEKSWLQMLFDLEYYVRRQRLKWLALCWLLGPVFLIGLVGWTIILSIKLLGADIYPENDPALYWQLIVTLAAVILCWPLAAWVTRWFFCRMMLGAFKRDPVTRQPQTWRITPERIHITTSRANTALKWSDVKIITATPHGYWLAQEPLKGIFLPRFALEEAGGLPEFEEILQTRNIGAENS